MTIEVTNPVAGPFYPNGVTVNYPFDFKVFDSTDLMVILRSAAGVLTTVNPATYSITLAVDGEGGTVTTTAPLPNDGQGLFVLLYPPFTQEVAVGDEGPFNQAIIDIIADRSAMRDLWLRSQMLRTVQVPFGETGLTIPAAAARANSVFTFDAFGGPSMLPKSTFRGDKGDPGGNVLAVGPWSLFETMSIPIGLDMVQTSDTLAAGSATGTASARYKLDPEQTIYTTKMQTFITASVAAGTPLATAQASMDALQSYWRRKSSNGRWFTLCEPEPWSGMFGTPGDGAQAFDNTMSGTDVWANMQAFIDYCVYFQKCKGRISPGTHRLSRGLQHGYGGGGFVGGVFEGAGQAYAGGSQFVGTTIICDTDEDPILNISADRDIVWEGVSFLGKLSGYLLTTAIAYPTTAPVAGYDSLNPQAWIDPARRSSQDGRFNPYACVTLGAYDGTKPVATAWAGTTGYSLRDVVEANGNSYQCITAGTSASSGGPSGTSLAIADGTAAWRYLGATTSDHSKWTAYREPYRPAWLVNPASSGYGNVYYGSFATFRNCTFRGGNVCLALKPGTNALQDDFLSCERCNFTECSFGFSAGNHQLRNLNMQSCNFGILQCAITSNTHGVQAGAFKAGHINCCGFGASVDVFRTDSSYGEPMVFTACYSEGQFRLGQVFGSAGYVEGMSPVFIACEWALSNVNAARGRPARQLYNQIEGAAGNNETFASGGVGGPVFINCRINVDGAFGCFVEGAKFINSQIYNYDRGTATVAPYLAAFDNATASGVILTGLDYRYEDQRLKFVARNLDTGAVVGYYLTVDGYRWSDRTTGIPAMVKTVRAKNGVAFEKLAVPHEGPFVLSKASGVPSFPSADPTELKIVYTGSNQTTHADLLGFGPGSVVLESATGTVWAVRSYDDATDTLFAVAINNYRVVGGVKSFVVPISLTVGSFAFLHARNYTPATPLFGDLAANVTATGTNGSPNLTAITGKLVPGQVLTHANIPANTTVLSVQGNTAVMTTNATGAVSGSIVAPTTIANVGTDTAVGTTISTSLAVGDYLASPQEINASAPATAKITVATNGSPGSITIDQNATKTVSHQRLAFFRRPTPANA